MHRRKSNGLCEPLIDAAQQSAMLAKYKQSQTQLYPSDEGLQLQSISVGVDALQDTSNILNRLPIVVLIKPLLKTNSSHSNTYDIALRASAEKESQYLKALLGTIDSSASPDPISVITKDSSMRFNLWSTAAQKKSRGCRLNMWSPPPCNAHIYLSADDDQSLIEACLFDGYVYLVYGDVDTVELKPFAPIPRTAARYHIEQESHCCWPSANRNEARIAHVHKNHFSQLGIGSILPPSTELYSPTIGLPGGNQLSLLELAVLELKALPIETLQQAKDRLASLTSHFNLHMERATNQLGV